MINSLVTVQSASRMAGGMYDAVRRLTQCLFDEGVTSRIYSLKDKWTAEDIGSWGELRPEVFATAGPGSYSPALAAAVAGCTKADIAHAHGLWTFNDMAVSRWAHTTGKPYVVSVHGMLNPEALKCSSLKKALAGAAFEKRYLRGASCVRALSASEVRAIRDYGVKGPVCIIPNGVDLPEPENIVSRSCDEKVLLYLGRLHPGKNLMNLLAAWSRIERRGWKLKIVGAGAVEYEKALMSSAGMMEELTSVEFCGPKYGNDKMDAYGEASALILPSLFEGSPLAVLEAWASGLPVIMTPECGLPGGYAAEAALRTSTDIDSIFSSINDMISMTDEQRIEMGSRGRQLVEKDHSWPDIARKMKSVFEWVLGGGKKPECVEMV